MNTNNFTKKHNFWQITWKYMKEDVEKYLTIIGVLLIPITLFCIHMNGLWFWGLIDAKKYKNFKDLDLISKITIASGQTILEFIFGFLGVCILFMLGSVLVEIILNRILSYKQTKCLCYLPLNKKDIEKNHLETLKAYIEIIQDFLTVKNLHLIKMMEKDYIDIEYAKNIEGSWTLFIPNDVKHEIYTLLVECYGRDEIIKTLSYDKTNGYTSSIPFLMSSISLQDEIEEDSILKAELDNIRNIRKKKKHK